MGLVTECDDAKVHTVFCAASHYILSFVHVGTDVLHMNLIDTASQEVCYRSDSTCLNGCK
jgi:hypothetical protein